LASIESVVVIPMEIYAEKINKGSLPAQEAQVRGVRILKDLAVDSSGTVLRTGQVLIIVHKDAGGWWGFKTQTCDGGYARSLVLAGLAQYVHLKQRIDANSVIIQGSRMWTAAPNPEKREVAVAVMR